MNLSELLESQAKAGQRYRAATIELRDALIDLAARDETLANECIGFDGRADIRTFFNVPQNLGALAHPVYAPLNTVECWREEIKAKRDDIIALLDA